MHPSMFEIAAYLDGAQSEPQRAQIRAHLLTCQRCTQHLRRLRQDANRMSMVAQAQAPDVRGAVRARLQRPHPVVWLARSSLAAGALAALLLFALLLGARGGATLGWVPERLFVLSDDQLVELNAENGMQRGTVAIGDSPAAVLYDSRQDRLYVLNRQGIVAIDPQALTVVDRWRAPQPLIAAQVALDARGGQLYVASPRQQAIIQIDTTSFTTTREIALTAIPDALAITPDARYLYAYSQAAATLEVIDLRRVRNNPSRMPLPGESSRAWLAASADGKSMYLLTYGALRWLYRVDVGGMRVAEQAALSQGEPPWGLVALADGRIAIPRGDGQHGGISIYDPSTLELAQQIDPNTDQHHVIVGPQNAVFAFTWNGALRRYAVNGATTVWSATVPTGLTDGVFVPAGWRWPLPDPANE